MVAPNFKPRVKSLALQQARLQRLFPEAACRIQRNMLTWVGRLTPTALSDTYEVRVTYSLEDYPRAYLVEPKMQRRDGDLPPHIYEEGRLCLYLPDSGDWNRTKLLAETIVPWASEWLLHYEIWLATGTWCGGGVHPVKVQPARSAKVKRLGMDSRPSHTGTDSTGSEARARTHDQPAEA
jgi:hypothetical protein